MRLDFHYAQDDAETATLAERDEGPARRPSVETLAEFALRDALGSAGLRAFGAPGTAVVVRCPDATWVEPMKEACALRGFAKTFARDGSARTEDVPGRGNGAVSLHLARGERVLGVSQDPARYLPSALVACADLTVTVPPPSATLVAEVIAAATGRAPRRPPEVAGLTYDEIAAQIRRNDPPRVALRRLAAAAAAKRVVDPAVAEAPPFEDLVGYGDEARAWGLELIRTAHAFRADGGDPRRHAGRAAVLAGHPGTGKTTLCASLARSAGLNLVPTSVASWFSHGQGYLGDVVRATNDAFAAAVANAPSLMLLDECDALPARGRISADHASWWSTACTNVLLQITQTLAHPTAFVAIVAATNHAESLDPALVRPGRLDRVIRIDLPTASELAGIVRQHLRGALADADLALVGRLGAGGTGAAAAGWVAQARAEAERDGRPIALADLVAAVAPPDRRPPELIGRVAIHEAGHALGVEAAGGSVESVSIVARDGEGGHTARRLRDGGLATLAEVEAEVVALLAGRAAEAVLLDGPGCGGGGEGSDLARATLLVARIHGALGLGARLTHLGGDADLLSAVRFDRAFAQTVERDLARLHDEAVGLVEAHRDAVVRVAEALMKRRSLDGDTVRRLLRADRPPRHAH